MVSQVTLGTFFTTSNGKTVLGGAGGSGLDTQSLISTLVTAKSQPITQDQTKITANTAQTTALNQFQSLLSTFQSASDALRNPPGVGNAANNVFKFTTASVSGSGSGVVSVTTQPGASLQTYTINNVTSLASGASQSTGTLTLDDATSASAVSATATAGMLTAGTVTINGQQITLDDGDTLNDVAAKFNAVSTNSGVSASVLQVSSGHFQLQFSSTTTGADSSFDLSSTSVDPAHTVFGNVTLGAATAGTDAKFKLNGVSIERSTNSINDAISGVTFNLLDTTSTDDTTNANIKVSIAPDTTTAQNSIVGFVNAYNALLSFAAQQTQLNSDGTYATTAILAGNPTFQSTMNQITTQVTAQVSGLAANFNSLSDIGITLTNQPASGTNPAVSNILTVDDGALASALSSNFQDVSNLFGLNFNSNNSNLRVFSASNSLAVSNFTLNIDPTNGIFTATYANANGNGNTTVNLTPTSLSSGGYSLDGPAGTPLEGLTMVYSSSAAATITASATQGVASLLYNDTDSAMAPITGSLAVALNAITTSTTSLNADITSQQTLVNQYQTSLINQFAALEQAISQTNTLLQSLNANSVAQQEAANIS